MKVRSPTESAVTFVTALNPTIVRKVLDCGSPLPLSDRTLARDRGHELDFTRLAGKAPEDWRTPGRFAITKAAGALLPPYRLEVRASGSHIISKPNS